MTGAKSPLPKIICRRSGDFSAARDNAASGFCGDLLLRVRPQAGSMPRPAVGSIELRTQLDQPVHSKSGLTG
jgi:hypothetical protein